jgi:hypothetical protein
LGRFELRPNLDVLPSAGVIARSWGPVVMSALFISLVVFVCLSGAILVGMAISRLLPDHHLDADSKDVIKLATAVVGTLAALALALLIASARTTYDNANAELRTSMARLVLLDRGMAAYGSETNAARARLRTLAETRLSQVRGGDISVTKAGGENASIESVQADLRALSPETNAQRLLQSQALQASGESQRLAGCLRKQSAMACRGRFSPFSSSGWDCSS